ncbi:MAG: transposase [Bacteroidales bacterium]
MIDKKIENTATETRLFPIKGKNIDLNFMGDSISSDGGLLLLREPDSQLNIILSAINCIHDDRDHRYIHHTVNELLSQLVFQIAASYEDCNDRDDLHEDMILKMCRGDSHFASQNFMD